MSNFLGIDTSNYTTSAALYDDDKNTYNQRKMLLPVKPGEKGLRQSDAVFHHTVQLPKIIEELMSENTHSDIVAVGVSNAPRSEEGSYMPCFLSGIAVAKSISSTINIPYYEFSHQQGHIAAVLLASGKTDLLSQKFIAFHLSGGTTEAVLVKPDKQNIFLTEIIARSLDLKAGQAIDRTGVMLGLQFPCGVELDKLSLVSDKSYKIKASVKNEDCSLSGIENKCKEMFLQGEKNEDIAKYCLMSIICSVDKMTEKCIEKYGNLPVVFSGGVSSNTLLRNYFTQKYNAVFAKPEYSADNAVGISFLTKLKFAGN